MNSTGGLGNQILGELGDVVKKTAEEVGKAGVDIAKGTIENVIGGFPSPKASEGLVAEEQTGTSSDPMQAIKQQGEINRRRGLQRVRGELARYVSRKKQEEEHKEVVEERQTEAVKQDEKLRQESEMDIQIRQAQQSGGGTGEMSRKKY